MPEAASNDGQAIGECGELSAVRAQGCIRTSGSW